MGNLCFHGIVVYFHELRVMGNLCDRKKCWRVQKYSGADLLGVTAKIVPMPETCEILRSHLEGFCLKTFLSSLQMLRFMEIMVLTFLLH